MSSVRTKSGLVWSAVVSFGAVSMPAPVSAFCRTTIVDESGGSCPEPCDTTGAPLFWDTPDIVYTFNQVGFPGMDRATESRLFGESFATWQAVRCNDAAVGFRFVEDSETSSELAVHHRTGPNKNVLARLSLGQWAAEDHSAAAFALTSVYYDKYSGKIYGADIEFNGGMPTFGECPADGCSSTSNITDLRNVATHEIGHVLGLAHSTDRLATMSCEARPGDTDKRSLGQDDVDALCQAYPPGESFIKSSTPTAVQRATGCSLQPASPAPRAGSHVLWALAALGLIGRFRRTPTRRRPAG